MKTATIALIAVACLVAPVLISYVVEALRRRPTAPSRAPWGADVSINYANIGGVRVRYLKTGRGPNLVLLHTLRTQLDIFQKIVPKLAEQFTVYACDYPGHGWSDIPHAKYAPEDFYQWMEAFLETVDIDEALLVGLSIGGTIALVLAARQNPRVTASPTPLIAKIISASSQAQRRRRNTPTLVTAMIAPSPRKPTAAKFPALSNCSCSAMSGVSARARDAFSRCSEISTSVVTA